MHRFLLILSLTAGLAAGALAQQQPLYTQFMFNKLALNPGYAGSQSARVTALYRNQWMGFEGAPKTMVVSGMSPLLSDRYGLGLNLIHHRIGISRITTAEVPFVPFRVPILYGDLSVGIQFGFNQLSQNWADTRLIRPQPGVPDNALPDEARTKSYVNAGAGLYYSAPGWYLGLAVPRLIKPNIDFPELGGGDTLLSRELQYFTLMAGYDFELAEGFILTPQALLKLTPNSPYDFELNLSALVANRFYGGLTFRFGGETRTIGESLAALVGMQATKELFIGTSYDITLTRIRRYSNGSIEAVVRYAFGEDVLDDPDAIETNTPWK